jgi:hypothetical protein
MISSVSSMLLSQRMDGFEDNIMTTLRTVGEFMRVDDIYFDVFDQNGSRVSVNEVHLGPARPNGMTGKDLGALSSEWLSIKIEENGYFIAGDINDLPDEAIKERRALSDIGARALILIPLEINFNLTGLLKVADSKPRTKYDDGVIPQLKVIVELLCSYVRGQEIQIVICRGIEKLSSCRQIETYQMRPVFRIDIAHQVPDVIVAQGRYAS